MNIERITQVFPGYDHLRNPCGKNGCGKNAGSNHGIHCDEWYFILKAEDIVGVFVVFTRTFPASVPRDAYLESRKSSSSGFELHKSWPTDREKVREGIPGNECKHLTPSRCFVEHSSLGYADEIWKRLGSDVGIDAQSEVFWLELEAWFTRWVGEVRAERADTKYRRCQHCDGLGTVAIASTESKGEG